MTMAQYALARFSRQLREELNVRELTDEEADMLIAIERDLKEWAKGK